MINEYETLLNDLYYNKLHLDGVISLHRKAKMIDKTIPLSYVSEWLKAQSTHQQTTVKRIGKLEYKKIVAYDNFSYQIDLTFLPRWKHMNKNNYVMFTAVNVNSRYAYVYYGKDKTTGTILDMLTKFKKDAKIITNITSDSGSEFRKNNRVTEWFEKNSEDQYFVVGDSHILGIVNRFHRTLKEKILKYFTANDTTTWIDVIDVIVDNYNNTVNRGIGMTPTEASNGFYQTMIISKAENKNNKIGKNIVVKKGDNIRIKKKRGVFDKGQTLYSDDTYEVDIIHKNAVTLSNGVRVKKDELIVVNNVEKHKPNIVKKEVEFKYKTDTKLIGLDMDPNNIIETKRIRKPKKY